MNTGFRKFILSAMVLSASVPAARATGEIVCESPDGGAYIMLGVGHLPVLNVISARVQAFGRTFAMRPEPGETEVAVGQAISTGGTTMVDLVDPNYEGILASVRLIRSVEEDSIAEAGVLTVFGKGAAVLVCGEQ